MSSDHEISVSNEQQIAVSSEHEIAVSNEHEIAVSNEPVWQRLLHSPATIVWGARLGCLPTAP